MTSVNVKSSDATKAKPLTPEKEKEITEKIIHRAELAKMARQLKFELGKVQSPTKKLRGKPLLLPNEVTMTSYSSPDPQGLKKEHRSSSPMKRNKHDELQYGTSNHIAGNNDGRESSSPTKKYKHFVEPTTPDGSTAYFNQLRKGDGRRQQVALKPHSKVRQQNSNNHNKDHLSERYVHAGQTLTQGSYLPADNVNTDDISRNNDPEMSNDDSFQKELGADLLMYLASSPYNSMNAAPSSVLKSIDGNQHLQHSSASINNYNILQTPSRNFGLEGLMASPGGGNTNTRLNGNNDGLNLLHHSSSDTNSNSTIDDHTDNSTKEYKQTHKNLKQQLQKEVIPMTPLNRVRGKSSRISQKSDTRGISQKKNQRNKVFDDDDDDDDEDEDNGDVIEENENDVTEDETDVEEKIRKSTTPTDLFNGDHEAVIGQENNYLNSHQFINKQAGQMMISSSPPREFDSPSVYTQLMLFSPAKANKGSQNAADRFEQTQGATIRSDRTEAGHSLGYMRRESGSRNGDEHKFAANSNLLKTPSRPINGVSGNTSGFFLPPNSATANFMMMKTPNTQQLASISRLLLDSGGGSATAQSNGIESHLEKLSAATRAVEARDDAGEQGIESRNKGAPHLESARDNAAANSDASKTLNSKTSSDGDSKDNLQNGHELNKNGQQNQNNGNFSMGEYMNNLFSPSPRVSSHRKN